MNYTVIFLAILYVVIVNTHFGWNLDPQSDTELICDGIAVIILAIGIVGHG